MTTCYFDSRSPIYRSPTGAVAAGTGVHLKVSLPRDMRSSRVRLCMERDGCSTQPYDMFWCGSDGIVDWWECDYTPDTPGLYFYSFEITSPSGTHFLNRGARGRGVLSQGRTCWQITAYSPDFVTPDWLAGGVMYQIFPDSFSRSGKAHRNVPAERVMLDWGAPPHWQPDENGEITNRRYYGGDLEGITQRLDYLRELCVTCIYLNPIFEAHENHRYNTADYTRIDPLLGTNEHFSRLCKEAKKRGMRVILDGVFSHTGADSIYFNRFGRYDSCGAYNSPDSPYRSWYSFEQWPDRYASWWGFVTLPELRETEPAVLDYFCGEKGIAAQWLGRGAGGWRLDVADELPDEFLFALRRAAKKENPDAVIIGEVWEDASTKCAYSQRRRYFTEGQLDSVMNYPFRSAILGFLSGADAFETADSIETILENYPPQVIRLLMNIVGTHDTERAITALAGESSYGRDRAWQSAQRLSPEQYALGVRRLKLAALMQFTLPGVPCIYYGDEVGVEGYRDPFNRSSFPWEGGNTELLEFYRTLSLTRTQLDCFAEGEMRFIHAEDGSLVYTRTGEHDSVLVALCARGRLSLELPGQFAEGKCVLGGVHNGRLELGSNEYALITVHR